MIREVVEDARLAAGERDLDLDKDLHPSTPAMMAIDRRRVHQVLTNLVSNAMKFTESGQITVRAAPASREVDGVMFSVADSGIGMTREDQGRVFESFVQADPSITRRYGGSGLGLAICQRLVSAMDGHIWVDSTPGTGSTFSFWLPLDD